MSSTKPVHIQGDKSVFLSKNAVDRMKKDIREGIPNEASSYLSEGWDYQITEDNDDEVRITILKTKKEEPKDKPKDSKLKNKIRSLREKRQSDRVTMHQLHKKREDIPNDLLETYAKLKKMGNPVISPVDALENLEETRKILQMTQGQPSNPYIDYYKSMKQWLDGMN